jgi:membrane protease YdiL (CAAX protease family)
VVEQQKQKPDIPYLSRTQVLIAMGVTSIILWTVAKLWLRIGDVVLFKWHWDIRDFCLGISLGVIITAISGLAYHFSPPYRRSVDYYLGLVIQPLVLPDLIWLGLLPGLSEELLFRGVMLPALGGGHIAVITSSLCFGVLHLSGSQQWPYVIWATIIGTVLGYSALIGGNLLIPIVAHIVTNCLSSYLWKIRKISAGGIS